jgi:peptidoglycan/xylan/chitin deacetylase (PgdA/CDA1 family)
MAALDLLIRLGLPVYCGGGRGNYVALTFDDGPGPYTARTLQILQAAGATATFFDVGKKLRYWPDLPREEAQIGVVGDHTWSHLPLTALPSVHQRTQILRARAALARATGVPVELFRPPEEFHSRASDKLVSSAGMLEVMWSTDSQDSVPGANSVVVLQNARDGLRPGAIILFHENRGSTLSALPALLQLIRDKGLQTVTVPELLALDPPTEAQVRNIARLGECVPGA